MIGGGGAVARDSNVQGAGPQGSPLVASWYLAGWPTEWYIDSLRHHMIVSFRDRWFYAFFADDIHSKKTPVDLEARLFRKIQMIDDAMVDQDLRVPPGNRFEKLYGSLKGFYSIRVSQQWRLVFRWDGSRGEASDVYLDDHSYR
jgi:proteic killer suppression protein